MSKSKDKTLSSLQNRASLLVKKLNWQSYHTPENLSLFLFSEMAELAEFCPWASKEEIMKEPDISNIKEEVADVLMCILHLLNSMNYSIPIETLIRRKMELDELEYPLDKFFGKYRYKVYSKARSYTGLKNLKQLQSSPSDLIPLSEIQKNSYNFAERRDWIKFYTPASLLLALTIKIGQISVLFQKRSKKKEGAEESSIWALTSAIITLLRFCQLVAIDNVYDLVVAKMKKDVVRFVKK